MSLLNAIGGGFRKVGRGIVSGLDRVAMGTLTDGGLLDLGDGAKPFNPTDDQRRSMRGGLLMNIGAALSAGGNVGEGFQRFRETGIRDLMHGRQMELQQAAKTRLAEFRAAMESTGGDPQKMMTVSAQYPEFSDETKRIADIRKSLAPEADEPFGDRFQAPDGKWYQQMKRGAPREIATGVMPDRKPQSLSGGLTWNPETGTTFPVQKTVNGVPAMVVLNKQGQWVMASDPQSGPINEGRNPVLDYEKPGTPQNLPTAGGFMRIDGNGVATPLTGPNGKPLMPTSTITNNFNAPAYGTGDAYIKSIGDYREPLPPLRGNSPQQIAEHRRLVDAVMVANPQYDSRLFANAQKALNAFGSGKEGREVTALNTVAAHLGALDDAISALNNGDVKLLNRVSNSLGVNVAGQTPAAAFKVITNRVKSEIVRAYDGTAGALGDRESAEHDFDVNLSPNILRKNARISAELLRGKIDGLANQFERNVPGRKFDGISQQAQAAYDRLAPRRGPQNAIPQVGGAFNGGRVLKVTRVP